MMRPPNPHRGGPSHPPPPPPPKRLAQHNISMTPSWKAPLRPPAGGTEKRKVGPVILITYATTEDAVRRALAAVQRDKRNFRPPQLIASKRN